MIHLNNIILSFGEQVIFDDISWHIKRQERIGLVGANGAGKTTLLKLLINLHQPDQGKITIAKNVTLGYLPQDPIEARGKGLLDEVLSSVSAIKSIEYEIHELQHSLADTNATMKEYQQRMNRLGVLQHQFEALGGFQLENEGKKILAGMGFEESEWEKPVETFSGGWQMRIALSKLLLQRPTLLLLDEPTNHLDIQTMEWLEGYLQNYEGTIIIVSHDRFFLERIVKKIVLLERGQLREYTGSFSSYEKQHELEEEQLWQQYERQKEEVARVERFVERFRYKASKASQVQSRVKQLEKMQKIIPPSAQKRIHFYFPTATSSGRIVFEARDISKSYNGKVIFRDVNLRIEKGEKVALVGVNGAGKSTLCRIIGDLETQTEGEVERGLKVKVAFYNQSAADALTSDNSVLDEVMTIAPYLEMSRLRTLLGCFLFTGDSVHKPVSVLSGGEKSRLALAKILLQETNFLVLDEPTNHLDATSKEVLQDALKSYQGTLVLVSHDRYFLDQVVSKVIEIERCHVREFLGNYSYYLDKREEFAIYNEPGISSPENEEKTDSQNIKKSKEQKRLEAEERQKQYEIKKQRQKKLKPIESQIERLEARKIVLEQEMTRPDFYTDPERTKAIMLEHKQISAELPQLYAEWEMLVEEQT
ncbi:ABC-F family ATP-binding cassette domain-containing protein [candidate division KSB1 bacterium]|nr:ABC-F family ATP-binding cassette domain-containing protein [candidate division KSB1 bacterium]